MGGGVSSISTFDEGYGHLDGESWVFRNGA